MYVHTRERDSRPGFHGTKIQFCFFIIIIIIILLLYYYCRGDRKVKYDDCTLKLFHGSTTRLMSFYAIDICRQH